VKVGLLAVAVGFGVALAVLFAQKLSDQAVGVVVGAVIGVVASVPMTAIVLWLMLRSRFQQPPAVVRHEYPPREEQPRIMVIQPQPYPAAPSLPAPVNPYVSAAPAAFPRAAREFKIVGESDPDDDDPAGG
jgi:hypothetical protein